MRKITLFILLSLCLSNILLIADAQSEQYPIISAENITALQSIQTYDFDDLPAGVMPAVGLFAVNQDATKVVTFGRYDNTPPLSLAILWGYAQSPIVNQIDDGSIARVLSNDGRCLYTGYREYFAVWELQTDEEMAHLVYRSPSFVGDAVNNIWVEEDNNQTSDPCPTHVYAEFIAADGTMYVVDYEGDIIQSQLFPHEDDDQIFARVGRIDPPLALTVTSDGVIWRWNMLTNTVEDMIEAGGVATYGAMNRAGTHYVWLGQDYSGLYIVDWVNGINRLLAPLNGVYISHLDISADGSVVLGTDPEDDEGTVSAWLVETGERLNLGPYRDCDRTQPDQVELSRDGTALVIGCDRGIDIWRVLESES